MQRSKESFLIFRQLCKPLHKGDLQKAREIINNNTENFLDDSTYILLDMIKATRILRMGIVTTMVWSELKKYLKLEDNLENHQMLLYLTENTKDEHYSQRASKLWKSEFETALDYAHDDLDLLYQRVPSYMEEETLLGKKERYYELVCGIRTIRDRLDQDPERSERDMCRFLLMMLHTIEVMSIEIFEHYKALTVLLKEMLKEQLDEKKESEDLYHSLTMSYLILKSCRLRILLKEKYQSVGEALIEKADRYFTTWIEQKDVEMLSLCLMAYAQLLQLKIEAGESITGFSE